jgi:SAM-dependent methyltransferase
VSEAARLAEAWAADLTAWAIPRSILDAAPESPYGFPTEPFVRRGRRTIGPAASDDPNPTTRRALEALAHGGSVLDIGVGGGGTSLPLTDRCTHLVAVDGQADMLEAVTRRGGELGLPVTAVHGRWPDVAPQTPEADVVVCGHVAYNAPDLAPFLLAMSSHARRRAVLELTDRHPLSWMDDLWMRFHGVQRPDGPVADDAHALSRALGCPAQREDRSDPADVAGSGFERRADTVALVRRRLCLPADRDDEIADALGSRLRQHDGLWSCGPSEQPIVTLWWDTG